MMKRVIKQLCPMIVVVYMSVFAAAFAKDCRDECNLRNSDGVGYTGQGTTGGYEKVTPTVKPMAVHSVDMSTTFDLIWWKTTQEGIPYAYSGVKTTGEVEDPFPEGTMSTIAHRWSLGFKAGLDMSACRGGWSLGARYTYLRPRRSQQILGDSSILIPDHIISEFSAFADKAEAQWKMKFNAVDIELGRNIRLGQCFTMKPFLGLKGVWQSTDTNCTYHAPDFYWREQEGFLKIAGPYYLHEKYDVLGIGMRAGLNGALRPFKNWSVYSNIAFSMFWTDYYNQRRVDSLQAKADIIAPFVHVHNKRYCTAKNLCEFELGVSWDKGFCDDAYHLTLQAGWEEQVFLNWTPSFAFVYDNWNNLSFMGLNARLRFDF